MELLRSSLRAVGRGVRRAPGFTLGIVALLTLGLGVNAVTFGLVDRLVLSGPAGLRDAGRLRRVAVHRVTNGGAQVVRTDLTYPDYRDLRNASLVAGAAGESSTPLLFGSGEDAERISAVLVTADYFPLLGVTPAVGRFFTAAESENDGARLVVLGHDFWRRRFHGDTSVVGTVLAIGSSRYTVVGVAPRRFTGSSVARVDVFLPLEAASDEQVMGTWRTGHNISWLEAVVRLAPGATDAAAEAALTAGYRAAREADPHAAEARVELVPLTALSGPAVPGEFGVAGLLAGVAGLVFLIALANIANLFLARSLRHREQIAVRLALGAGRRRLVAEQALEGALLALLGAAAAIAVAGYGSPVVQRLLFPDVDWLETSLNVRLLAFVGGAAVLGGAAAAALPVWLSRRLDLVEQLKAGGPRAARRRTRTQSVLLVAQGALSVVLIVGAALFVRSFTTAQSLNLGIEPDRLLLLSAVRSQDAPLPSGFLPALRERVERMPGVEATTIAGGTLPFVSSWSERLTVPGLPELPRVDDGGPYVSAVEPGYFAVAGTKIVRGRAFQKEDRAGAPAVAIVNESMARLFWPGQEAIGQCLQIGKGAPCSTVVGIAENTRRQAIVEGDSLLYYVPLDQMPAVMADAQTRLVVRTRGRRARAGRHRRVGEARGARARPGAAVRPRARLRGARRAAVPRVASRRGALQRLQRARAGGRGGRALQRRRVRRGGTASRDGAALGARRAVGLHRRARASGRACG